jgi:transcription elongation factor/antiterminator RfaH
VIEAWYAVYTKFQHEKSAAKVLESKQFEVLLPIYQTMHRWKDRNKMVTLPLFPCYLFLRTNIERKADVLRTPGVRWIVENGGCATPILETEIEAIRRITSSPSKVQPHPFLKHGQSVRIRKGPFAGNEGILERIKNQYRVIVSVELIQRSVALEIDLSDVEAASPSHKFSPHLPAAPRDLQHAASMSRN